jgi:beta-phosphoglucomutase
MGNPINLEKIEAIFFDVDDTLCATGKLHEQSFIETLKSMKKDILFDYQKFKGLKTEDVFRGLGFSLEEVETAVKYKREYFSSLIPQIEPMLGAQGLLEYLSDRGFKLAAVSSGSRSNVTKSLKKSGLAKYFQFTICAEDCGRAKPDPEPYLLAKKVFGLKKHSCLVVEDSMAGIKSAISAGMQVVFVSNFDDNLYSPSFRSYSNLGEFEIDLRRSDGNYRSY